MNAEFINALNELEEEKGISKEVLLDAIKTALVAAYKRDFGMSQNARVDIDETTGVLKVFAEKTVVDDVFDDTFEISLEDARKINMAYELGDIIIAPDVAARQSTEFGNSFEQEVSLLIVHGLLHLCGYDHIVDEEAEVMEARERELLTAWTERDLPAVSENR